MGWTDGPIGVSIPEFTAAPIGAAIPEVHGYSDQTTHGTGKASQLQTLPKQPLLRLRLRAMSTSDSSPKRPRTDPEAKATDAAAAAAAPTPIDCPPPAPKADQAPPRLPYTVDELDVEVERFYKERKGNKLDKRCDGHKVLEGSHSVVCQAHQVDERAGNEGRPTGRDAQAGELRLQRLLQAAERHW